MMTLTLDALKEADRPDIQPVTHVTQKEAAALLNRRPLGLVPVTPTEFARGDELPDNPPSPRELWDDVLAACGYRSGQPVPAYDPHRAGGRITSR